jgi:hypothetical protein
VQNSEFLWSQYGNDQIHYQTDRYDPDNQVFHNISSLEMLACQNEQSEYDKREDCHSKVNNICHRLRSMIDDLLAHRAHFVRAQRISAS